MDQELQIILIEQFVVVNIQRRVIMHKKDYYTFTHMMVSSNAVVSLISIYGKKRARVSKSK